MTSCLLAWITVFPKWDLLLKNLLQIGSTFFSVRTDPNEMGGKIENDIVGSLGSVPNH